ncbi:MAG: hypothetical protein ABIA37_00085 [Candidatus Woesearchaeota archaeon]
MDIRFSKIERGGRKTILPKWCLVRRNSIKNSVSKKVVRAAASSKIKRNVQEDTSLEELSGSDDDGGGGSPPISLEEEVKRTDTYLPEAFVIETYQAERYVQDLITDYELVSAPAVEERQTDDLLDEVIVIGAYKSVDDFLGEYEDSLKRATAYDDLE